MTLKNLRDRPGILQGSKSDRKQNTFQALLNALRDKDLPDPVTKVINLKIDILNAMPGIGNKFRKGLSGAQYKILKYLEKELKLVPKNHYQKTWMAMGMVVLGIPIGVAMGTSIGNMGLMGAGIAVGLAIGIAVG